MLVDPASGSVCNKLKSPASARWHWRGSRVRLTFEASFCLLIIHFWFGFMVMYCVFSLGGCKDFFLVANLAE